MALAIDPSTPAVAVQTNNVTSTVQTASFTPPSNCVLLIGWAWNTQTTFTPSAPSITDSLGAHLTYSLLFHRARPETATDGQAAMWSAPVGTGAAMTVTVTAGGSTGLHGGAVKVWVLTGQDTTDEEGAGGEGGATVATTSVAMSYTAEASASQGFGALSDWALAGAKTGGTGTTMDASGNAGSEISYAFARRTTPDGSAGATTTVNVTTPSSNALMWVFTEIKAAAAADDHPLPQAVPPGIFGPAGMFTPWTGYEVLAAAATAESGSSVVALTASASAVKVASCSGTARVAVAGTGTARKTALAAGAGSVALRSDTTAAKKAPETGAALVAVTSTGAVTVAGARPQSATCTVALSGTGTARKSVSRTGTATVALSTIGAARKTAAPSGAAVVALRGTAAAAKLVSRTGLAELALRATGTAAKTSPAAGSAVVALRTAAAESKTVSRTGTAMLALVAASSSAVARLQTGTCVLAVSTSAAARKVATATGTARAALVAAGLEVKRATPTGSAALATRSAGTARKTSTPTGSAILPLRCTATATAKRTQAARCVLVLAGQANAATIRGVAGRALLTLQAHSYVGAPPPPPPVGMDQGSATAPLLSGTATPGPTLGGDVGTGITSDMALVTASTVG